MPGKEKKEMVSFNSERLLQSIRASKYGKISEFARRIYGTEEKPRTISRTYLSSCIHSGRMDKTVFNDVCYILDHAPAFYTEESPVVFLDPVKRDFSKIPEYALQEKLEGGLTLDKVFEDLFLVLGYSARDAQTYATAWPFFAGALEEFLQILTKSREFETDAAGVTWEKAVPADDSEE